MMAETSGHPAGQMNGDVDNNGYVDEEERLRMRPPDIEADMKEMEKRKRVEVLRNESSYCEQLENILRDGPRFLWQSSRVSGACVTPINDVRREVEPQGYVKGEKMLRSKLAALIRLADMRQWTHVPPYGLLATARLSQQDEHFLANPDNLAYNEVTISSLMKVDMRGCVVESGSVNGTWVNGVDFQLDAVIYAFRPDIRCILRVKTHHLLAVCAASGASGLWPISENAAVLGDISSISYARGNLDADEKDKIARNLGPHNKVLFLPYYGALCCGESIDEAFFNACNLVAALKIQKNAERLGKDNVSVMPEDARRRIYAEARKVPDELLSTAQNAAAAKKKWKVGVFEFESQMRMLDNQGFRTGYTYRFPMIKIEPPRPHNDVELPPATSSFGYLIDEEEMYKNGHWKKQIFPKGSDRTRWLNSPNAYQKLEILETGTTDPKKITKWVDANNEEWVTDGSPNHTSTPVKIDNALQFVPKNTNAKEFKQLQKQIKENRRADKITSGPQSHILEGVTWDEAKQFQDSNATGTSDHILLVGAASKGIIQRDFQHNATVYKAPYAKNPFDAVTDEDLENYTKAVTRKDRGGDSMYEGDQSESEALSASLPPSGRQKDLEKGMMELQIERSTAPKPSNAEIVLSDDDTANGHFRRAKSARFAGEHTYTDHSDAHQSTFSEGSPNVSTEESLKKKKKKKGLSRPSFLKKKDKKKKSAEASS